VAAFQNYLRITLLSALGTYLLSLCLGVYLDGAYNILFTKPIRLIDGFRAVSEIRKRDRIFGFHQPARDDKKGVVVFNPANTYGDLTFFSTAWAPKAYLIDLKGSIVHEWNIDWDKIWPDRREWPPEVSPYNNVVSRAFLQPDGSVYAMFTGEGGAMGGYGLVKIDKDSKVIWKYNQFANHDISIMPNGNILTFAGKLRYTPYPAAPFLKPPFAEPQLVTLDRNGKEIDRLSVFDMFANAPQAKFLMQMDKMMNPQPDNGDIFHPNTITRITAEAAARNPAFQTGQYLLSFRNFNMLAVVDLDVKKITWVSYGPWQGQHSPRFIDDGTLVMFDNLGNLHDDAGLSRILNVDPATGEILWEYDGTDHDPVFSSYNSGVDPLPNGNVLATETETGRIFEVTRDKEIVWDYRAPERIYIAGRLRIPSLFSGRRFRREDLPFLMQTKTP
jgi:hypothetical protein